MADPGISLDPSVKTVSRFLTFWSEQRLYALPADEIAEVIRVPELARVPQAPAGLLGLANVRGAVLSMASLRGLLGQQASSLLPASRAIVLNGATGGVALVVDAVDGLQEVDAEGWDTGGTDLAGDARGRLRGAFRTSRGDDIAEVIDTERLFAAAFAPKSATGRRPFAPYAGEALQRHDSATVDTRRIVTFEVAGQEYGFEASAVREVLPAPAATTAVPRSDAAVFGLMAYRNHLLPLLSLRGLLGLPAASIQGSERILVTTVRGVLVGLVADRTRDILAMDPQALEPLPAMLAMRSGGEAQIKSIYRGEHGRRLVSILDAETLFREDIMQRLQQAEGSAPEREGPTAEDDSLHFLVFRLDGSDFGLPIAAVEEVAQVPMQITRVPRAPKFLAGVVSHRGSVLPVIDQRSRFDMPPSPGGTARRLLIVQSARHRAGLIVDSVSEVLRTERKSVAAAPDLTGQANRLVDGVVDAKGRMVLTLDPDELLSRAERGLLEAFEAKLKTKPR